MLQMPGLLGLHAKYGGKLGKVRRPAGLYKVLNNSSVRPLHQCTIFHSSSSLWFQRCIVLLASLLQLEHMPCKYAAGILLLLNVFW
jgi:hypothetical protein